MPGVQDAASSYGPRVPDLQRPLLVGPQAVSGDGYSFDGQGNWTTPADLFREFAEYAERPHDDRLVRQAWVDGFAEQLKNPTYALLTATEWWNGDAVWPLWLKRHHHGHPRLSRIARWTVVGRTARPLRWLRHKLHPGPYWTWD